MQALMLAAGMGRRMGKYTEAMTKCMIEVGGRTLLQRAVDALKEAGITKFVMVVGWECDKLVDYIQRNISGMDFQFVYNYDYATTNNIYSLYLARDYLAQDDTILLESDLVYESSLLKKIVEDPRANLVAVAKYEHWMDGTVTTLDEDGNVLFSRILITIIRQLISISLARSFPTSSIFRFWRHISRLMERISIMKWC